MSQTVVGIFEHVNQAQEAKAYLVANGFNSENIDINTIAGSNYGDSTVNQEEDSIGEKIGKFFSNLFSDENDVSSHVDAARRGTTVTVFTTTEDQTLQAVQILDNFGAVDVNDFAQSGRMTGDNGVGAGTIGTDPLSATDPLDTDLINTDVLDADFNRTNSNDAVANTGSSGHMPVIDEELQVGKQEVQTGGVRVRSRIVEHPAEERTRLGHQHVNIEDMPVVPQAAATDFQGGTIGANETAETDHTINKAVRRTDVDAENLDNKDKI